MLDVAGSLLQTLLFMLSTMWWQLKLWSTTNALPDVEWDVFISLSYLRKLSDPDSKCLSTKDGKVKLQSWKNLVLLSIFMKTYEIEQGCWKDQYISSSFKTKILVSKRDKNC